MMINEKSARAPKSKKGKAWDRWFNVPCMKCGTLTPTMQGPKAKVVKCPDCMRARQAMSRKGGAEDGH